MFIDLIKLAMFLISHWLKARAARLLRHPKRSHASNPSLMRIDRDDLGYVVDESLYDVTSRAVANTPARHMT
jgi:hypothetical protein